MRAVAEDYDPEALESAFEDIALELLGARVKHLGNY